MIKNRELETKLTNIEAILEEKTVELEICSIKIEELGQLKEQMVESNVTYDKYLG